MKSSFDLNLLMELQYNLPLSETPLVDLAERLGYSKEYILKELSRLIRDGVVKRYGANLNYRAFEDVKKAALVGFSVKPELLSEVANKINELDSLKLKHNFLRDHESYNIWFTIKAESVEEIEKMVGEIAKKCNVSDYVVLPTKRVWKMDVKYDLFKGVSWSERGVEPENVPTVNELGLDADVVRKLESLEVCERPFKLFEIYGYTQSEIVDILDELLKKNVARDFSGVLRESKIGFKENGMTILKVDNPKKVALKLVEKYPQITHLVERITNKNWDYPIYFMVHAVDRKPIESIREEVKSFNNVLDAVTIYSKKNLRDS